MKKLFVFLLLLFIGASSVIFAQNKSQMRINGKITDATTGEVLPGVNILVQGTLTGTISEVDGRYSVLVSGAQSVLVFSFIGYEPQTVTVGAQSAIDIALNQDVQTLGEVVITAQGRGQKQAVQQQINSNTIKNVVAPDRLQENPDANATEAIGRLPGISIIRSGGEGTGLVIRGLEPRYSAVSLNGIQMASTSGTGRETNISGISQYALQGVEVFKSLTPDMEGNSVAGTVNLKLREAPEKFHVNFMAQGGYNHLNDYWGNYKLLGEVSNRFLNNKLGVLLSLNAERVNRSIQTMGADYGIEGNNPNGDILLNYVGLNNNSSIIYRKSALLSLDYKVSPGTTLMFYGMFNTSKYDFTTQSKSYACIGAGSVGYNFGYQPDNTNNILQMTLSGESKINFLNIKADYGISYSRGYAANMGARSWGFTFNGASSSAITDIAHRKMTPQEILPLFTDDPSNFMECWLNGSGMSNSKTEDKNLTTYMNLSVPVKIGDVVTGNIKFGGMFREKDRTRNDLVGFGNFDASVNVVSTQFLSDSLPWIVKNSNNNISAVNIADKPVKNFLGGNYNFGYSFNMDRLNEIYDEWHAITKHFYDIGPAEALPIIFDYRNITFIQDPGSSILNNQNIREKYYAGYIMPEFDIGKYVMFMPGMRYEKTSSTMKGFYGMPPILAPTIFQPMTGDSTSATRSDEFFLPMIHLRIKPTNKFYMHFSYTQTLSRPDFNAISPNTYVNTGWSLSYTANNPKLKCELWTNYDAQFTLHGDKIGLLSVTGFYKTVKDKIWQRSYTRIKGDPLISPFPDAALVVVSIWENHPYTAYVEGVEFEWQTSFYYLPKPFSFFTLDANYTYSHTKTTYPNSRIMSVVPPGGGRPVATRIDSTVTGPMIYAPKDMANVSLGFNLKGFNAWFSFQYNGLIYMAINYRGVPRLDREKDRYYKLDLQLTQKITIGKVKGIELIANFANLTNYKESNKLRGDPRPTYQEQYGWTADLGLRYRF